MTEYTPDPWETAIDGQSVNSDTVSAMLDLLGMSDDQITWRRNMYDVYDFVSFLPGIGLPRYLTGSRAEGIGTHLFHSDIDVMLAAKNIHLITDTKDWIPQPSKIMVLLLTTSGVHPGYARIVPMYNNVPELVHQNDLARIQVLGSGALNFVLGVDDSLFLLNDAYENKIISIGKHGPAKKLDVTNNEIDHVPFLDCPTWPIEAIEWQYRVRLWGWPPGNLMQIAVERGCFLVPTSHEFSPWPEIEWRFSFSLIEKDLMRTLTNKHMKCYVLLKVLKKKIFEMAPNLRGKFSSYHLKTILFWSTEELGLDHWSARSLDDCFVSSIRRLIKCIHHEMCSNYFIRDNNMMLAMRPCERQLLLEILHCCASDGLAVFKSSPDFKFWYYYVKNDIPVSDEFIENKTDLKYEVLDVITCQIAWGIERVTYNQISVNVFDTVSNHIDILCRMHEQRPSLSGNEADVHNNVTVSLECSLISHLACLCYTKGLSNRAVYAYQQALWSLMSHGVGSETITVKLKKANILYVHGKYTQTLRFLRDVLSRLKPDVRSFTGRSPSGCSAGETDGQKQSFSRYTAIKDLLETGCTFDVLFYKTELTVMPHALKFEVFKQRTFKETVHDRLDQYYNDICVLDSIVFLRLLQYLCFSRMNKTSRAAVALHELELAVETHATIKHRESGFNVISHCHMQQGDYNKAFTFAMKSVRLRAKSNAAYIQIAILLKNAIANRSMLGYL